MVGATQDPAWGPVKRLLFRLAFAYLLLYNLPFPLYSIPYVGVVADPYAELWNKLVPWVGKQAFGLDINVVPNGSGDTTFNYVQVFCFLVLAVIAAGVWTLLDRRRPNYARLQEWLRVYIRFALAVAMITYGAIKVIKSQFPAPTLDRLMETYGDSSPMGLLWTFMGASASYSAFTGASEMLGGLLLTVRRTTLLGALVSAGVMTNVVMLNFSYDVPVKLYSLHLLAMAVFLAAPDLRRLADLFLLNRKVEPAPVRPLFARKGLDRGALVLRTVCVVGFVAMSLVQASQTRRLYGELAPKSPLYGIWNVERFEVDGVVRPPTGTEPDQWRRLIFDVPRRFAIQTPVESRRRYFLELDPIARQLVLTTIEDPDWKATLSYKKLGPDLLALEGPIDGRKIRAMARRAPTPEFLLVNRGFHWINEYPFNR